MNEYTYFNGVAQGSPLSPTLATLILIPALQFIQGVDNIFYADDGALYSDKEFNPKEILGNINKQCGISVHPEGEKSSWVKYNGTWKKPLKFLGMKYIPNTLSENKVENELVNATKTPKPFTFERKELFNIVIEFDKWLAKLSPIGHIIKDKDNCDYIRSDDLHWSQSKYFGYITSRLYLGNGLFNFTW